MSDVEFAGPQKFVVNGLRAEENITEPYALSHNGRSARNIGGHEAVIFQNAAGWNNKNPDINVVKTMELQVSIPCPGLPVDESWEN
jgi:hypothetical protein